MLWRVVLSAVAFTYLLCVLVLSGMQKEDLDVALLQKLQKHNVNTNILDSEQLRTECMVRKFSKPEETDIFSSTAGADPTVNSDRSVRDVANLNSFKEAFMDLHNRENNRISLMPKRKKNDQSLEENITSDVTKIPTTIVNISVTEIAVTEKKTVTESSVTKTNAKENQTKLENVIKFWQMYVRNVSAVSPSISETGKPVKVTTRPTEPPTTRPQNTQKVSYENKKEPENVNSSEIERISKVIAKLIYNKRTTESPLRPEQKDVLDTVSKQINDILKINTDGQNIREKHESERTEPFVTPYKDKSWSDETLPTFAEFQSHAESPSYYGKSRYERQKQNSQFDKFVRISTNTRSITPLDLHNHFNFDTEKAMVDDDIDLNIFKTNYGPVTTDSDNLDKLYSENASPAALPAEVIKQLADNIKEMVLKDIRKEITIKPVARNNSVETSTTKIAATTTANKSVVNLMPQDGDHVKIQQATKAIEKFLKLIEKLENTNEKNVNLMGKLVSEGNENKYGMVTPVLPYFHHDSASHPVKGSTFHPLPPITIAQPPRIPGRNPFLFKVPSIPKQKINGNILQTGAIMIQTNSKEIPPLGIRMSGPMLLNQNLFVTTRGPWATTVMYSDQPRFDYMAKYGRNPTYQDEIAKQKARLSEYSNIPKPVPDIILTSSNNGPYIDKYKSSVTIESVANKPYNRYQLSHDRYKFVPKGKKNGNYKDIRKIIGEYDVSKGLSDGPINYKKAVYDEAPNYGSSMPWDSAFYPYKDSLRMGIDYEGSYKADKYKYNEESPQIGSRWSAARGTYDVPKAITQYNDNFKNLFKANSGPYNDNIKSAFKTSGRYSDNFKKVYKPSSIQYDDNFKTAYKPNNGLDVANTYASSRYEPRKDIFSNLKGHYIKDEDLSNKYDFISKPSASSRYYSADNKKYTERYREPSVLRSKPLEFSDRFYRELNEKKDFTDRHKDVVKIDEEIQKSHPEAYHFKSQFAPSPTERAPRGSDIRGFHEQLEKTDYTAQDFNSFELGGKDKANVATTREQQPLSGVKLGAKFDDTHFQDFLKTQQKVNDMLEKILSGRPKQTPRSVEAA